MAPNGVRKIFFLLIQTLPTFWAERILILRIYIFGIFLDSKFPDFQVPRFPDFRKIGPYSSGDHFSESCSPRKMMQNGIDEIFWGQTFKNTLYFNLRAADFWKPLTCRYVAQGCLFSRKKAPIFLEVRDLWVRCSRLFFPQQIRALIFLEAPNLWVRCRRCFFSTKKGPIFLEALLSRTARIHQIWARIMRARHGNICHGTDPPDHGTARHGTSLPCGTW